MPVSVPLSPEALLWTPTHEFPVTDNLDKSRGILTSGYMVAGLRRTGARTPVAEVRRTDNPLAPQSIVMQQCRCLPLTGLSSAERLVILFTPENVDE